MLVFGRLNTASLYCEYGREVCATATVDTNSFVDADAVAFAAIGLHEVAFGQVQLVPEDSTEQRPVISSWQT